MAKIISLASSKVYAIANGYEIRDEAYVQALEANTDDIIGGISKGLNLLLNTGERLELRYITGVQTFANLPKLFEVQPLSAPTLTSPADEATDVAINATLSWGAVSGAEGYEVDFNGSIEEVSGTSYQIAAENDETYTWKVRAIGPEIPGTWSAERSFTTVSA